jgi:hypothetical protein
MIEVSSVVTKLRRKGLELAASYESLLAYDAVKYSNVTYSKMLRSR